MCVITLTGVLIIRTVEMNTLPVPPPTYSEHYWYAEDDGRSGRARRAAASGPYRATIPAKIEHYTPTLSSAMAADLEEAASTLTQFDTFATEVLGGTASAVPMSAIMLRTESASSSQIEQLTVGARQLALAEIDQSTSVNAKTVIGNVRAMQQAMEHNPPIDIESILAIHRTLLSHQDGWDHHAGRFRRQLVWVGSSGLGPRGATHIGPQPEFIEEAMFDLVAFMNRVDLPAILHVSIAHAQFETIHPFVDGNGRTGRVLIHSMLRNSGMVTGTSVPVSSGLLIDTPGYFEALNSYRQGNALPIVEKFTDAIRFASIQGKKLIQNLESQLISDRDKLAHLRSNATAWQVLPWLIAHPVVNSNLLATVLGLSPVASQRALAQLTESGILMERSGYKRNRVWQHDQILEILDAYAETLRRA